MNEKMVRKDGNDKEIRWRLTRRDQVSSVQESVLQSGSPSRKKKESCLNETFLLFEQDGNKYVKRYGVSEL